MPPREVELEVPTNSKTRFYVRVEDAQDEGEPEELAKVNESQRSAEQRAARSRRRRD